MAKKSVVKKSMKRKPIKKLIRGKVKERDTKEIIDLIKEAKWDCTRRIRLKLPLTHRMKAAAKRYPQKFFVKNKKFYVEGVFAVSQPKNVFEKLIKECKTPENKKIAENFRDKATTCQGCKYEKPSCAKRIQRKEKATKMLITQYKNIGLKFADYKLVDLDDQKKEEFWGEVSYGIIHAIWHYKWKKDVKFSTYATIWIKNYVVEFYTYIKTGRKRIIKKKEENVQEENIQIIPLDEAEEESKKIKEENIQEEYIQTVPLDEAKKESKKTKDVESACIEAVDFNKFDKNQQFVMRALYDRNFDIEKYIPNFASITLKRKEYDAIGGILKMKASQVKQIERECIAETLDVEILKIQKSSQNAKKTEIDKYLKQRFEELVR